MHELRHILYPSADLFGMTTEKRLLAKLGQEKTVTKGLSRWPTEARADKRRVTFTEKWISRKEGEL